MEAFSQKMDCTTAEAAAMIGRIVALMTDELQEGNAVGIHEFGTFEVKKKMERISVIPSTQQRVLVPPKLVLGFKPSQGLKEKLK